MSDCSLSLVIPENTSGRGREGAARLVARVYHGIFGCIAFFDNEKVENVYNLRTIQEDRAKMIRKSQVIIILSS